MSGPVFVSYSQPDRDTAFAVVAHLEQHEVPCWIAPRDVAPGSEWAEQIIEAIARACLMVLVFSSSSNGSPQVCREVERAVHRRVRVLPFRVEDVLPARSLEFFLSTQHWLDAFPPPLEPYYAHLTTYVKTLLATAPGAEWTPEGAHGTPRVAGTGGFDAAMLARLEGELARFIGPVARHLVHRAAPRSSGLEELLARLGGEIASEVERREFLAAARRALRAR
ncbi:MAG: toll/interleukin-1 receptor domain-containing protein [Gammaproteobacteria bacterium]|nr:toll/interleukin-1 receptor domain-containing protein [Gammaproteobacteria bacterium]